MNMLINNKQKTEQSGFAALVIAMILIIILSLLTVGFAQIIRNESHQATNRQLSSQAYYAAESGINDAFRAIQNGYVKKKTTCPPIAVPLSAGEQYLSNNVVSNTAGTNTRWTCLIIDTAPTSLEYGSIDTVTPTVFTASAVDAGGLPVSVSSITVAWQSTVSTNTTFAAGTGVGNASFPKATSATWPYPGVLRFAVTPYLIADRASLIKDTFTAFLYPRSGGLGSSGSTTYTNTQSSNGPIVDGSCNVGNASIATIGRYCSVNINIPGPGIAPNQKMLFNLRSIYGATNARIVLNGGSAHLLGAQSLVDSTGQAQDVIKRIQVRVPAGGNYYRPGFSLDSMTNICKKLEVSVSTTSGCGY